MISRLFEWLDNSTSSFLAVSTIAKELDRHGFVQLAENDDWQISKGGKYYVIKNSSAIFAFVTPQESSGSTGYRIVAAHSDSPCLKLKPHPEIIGEGGVVTLNVEKYGGGILYTWFDRPLSMSGRVIVKSDDFFKPKEIIFDLKRPVAIIPHLAIHFNRSVNEGHSISVQKEMKPVLGIFNEEQIKNALKEGGLVKKMIADYLGIPANKIIDSEVSLYILDKASKVGYGSQLYQSGRIDDLSMAFAGLEALISECDKPSESLRVLAVFDNEETGSTTKQGAASPILKNILQRIEKHFGGSEDTFLMKIANSFMISADCAHAWHPNYNEKHDPTNHPVVGGGPVIKINANGKYMTDAVGAAIFKELCNESGVNCQYFVNHSDVAGGSTLGNIATSQIAIKGVDVGAPIWAMHSAIESAGISDYEDFVKVFRKFWELS